MAIQGDEMDCRSLMRSCQTHSHGRMDLQVPISKAHKGWSPQHGKDRALSGNRDFRVYEVSSHARRRLGIGHYRRKSEVFDFISLEREGGGQEAGGRKGDMVLIRACGLGEDLVSSVNARSSRQQQTVASRMPLSQGGPLQVGPRLEINPSIHQSINQRKRQRGI
ncbi:hypothetical protein K431DRAFT_285283 [Polychaeton citri CBS 116435]|uniref:Uncharacterized protein n=1 Tax=Polychaeton citri CBS 116435 TaxID=1314669 RepID=A0A9P4QAE2_9PEZI|nr:hypothetical protein K431DRAFT_285283 [Polychaeton citri CBS 116435]